MARLIGDEVPVWDIRDEFGDVRYLSAGGIERAKAALLGPLALTRVWDHFRRRAEYGGEPDALATERAGMRDA